MDSNPSNSIPDWTARQVVLATLFVVAVGLAFWLLFRYHMVVVILFSAIILGTALRPMVDWFARRGFPRTYGVIAVYSILLAGLVVFLLVVVPIIASQMFELAVEIPRIYRNFRTVLVNSPSFFLMNLGVNLPQDLSLMVHTVPVKNEPLDAVSRFIGLTGSLLSGILAVFVVLLLASFWVLESDRTLRAILLVAPLHLRQSARELLEAVEIRVGAYVRGQLILCSVIGLLALIAYLIIGLPNALTLALIAGVFEAIPVLGPALGALPAMLVAFSLQPTLALWVLLATVIIQGLENYLLAPRVMRASVGVNPILTLLFMVTFTSLVGLPGALLAIPSAAVIQLLSDRYILSTDQNSWSASAGRDFNSVLRYEVQDLISDVRKQLRKKGARSDETTDQVEDAIEALALELNLFLEEDARKEIS